MIDFHGRTTPDMASQYAKVLEPYRPFFIEEPCLPENVLGMAKVAQSVEIPVATGERLVTRFQFRELLEKGAWLLFNRTFAIVAVCGKRAKLPQWRKPTMSASPRIIPSSTAEGQRSETT